MIPGVYLGDYKDALNAEQMEKLGITHVLTVLLGSEPRYPDRFRYMTVRAQDHHSQDLLSYLEELHAFIDEGKREGAVLVHCRVGQSRSAMVMASYIMKEKGWNKFEALEYLKSIRSKIKPNRSFLDQLEAYNLFKRDLSNVELQQYTSNYPNKAQLTLWPKPGTFDEIQYLPQPIWVKELFWREFWDSIVHLFMDFYNRYLRYYAKK